MSNVDLPVFITVFWFEFAVTDNLYEIVSPVTNGIPYKPGTLGSIRN